MFKIFKMVKLSPVAVALMLSALSAVPAFGQVQDTIRITVETPPPPPPAGIEWSGPTTGLPGDTLTIDYFPVDSTGAPTEGVVTWELTDAAVAQIVATTDSTVTVVLLQPGAVDLISTTTSPTEPTDPPADPQGEPEGFVPFTEGLPLTFAGGEADIDALDASGYSVRRDAPDGPFYMRVVNDVNPVSGVDSILRLYYNPGMVGGGGSPYINSERVGPPHSEVYMRYVVRISENYQGHPSGINKIGYNIDHCDGAPSPCGNFPLIFSLDNVTTWGVSGQGHPDMIFRTKGGDLPLGQWIVLEIYVRYSKTDGKIIMWADGVEVVNVDRPTIVPTALDELATGWQFRPIWGGVNGDVTETFTLDIAEIYVSIPGN